MAHQTPSTNQKGKTRAEFHLNIPSSRSQSQQATSQTLRYFTAAAEPAAPYISPYPPTTALNPISAESALPVYTSTVSASLPASSIYSSAGSTSGNMSSSRAISAVCGILVYPFPCFPKSIFSYCHRRNAHVVLVCMTFLHFS